MLDTVKTTKLVLDKNERIAELEQENEKLKEDNELLNNELAWMKAHTRYNWITQEEYIDWTMSVTEAKLRMRQAKDKQNYISKLEEENKRLKEAFEIAYMCVDKTTKENRKLKEEIDNWFNRETDLRNRRADSLLENKDLRDKIEELEKEIEELNKMMLFETELEK